MFDNQLLMNLVEKPRPMEYYRDNQVYRCGFGITQPFNCLKSELVTSIYWGTVHLSINNEDLDRMARLYTEKKIIDHSFKKLVDDSGFWVNSENYPTASYGCLLQWSRWPMDGADDHQELNRFIGEMEWGQVCKYGPYHHNGLGEVKPFQLHVELEKGIIFLLDEVEEKSVFIYWLEFKKWLKQYKTNGEICEQARKKLDFLIPEGIEGYVTLFVLVLSETYIQAKKEEIKHD